MDSIRLKKLEHSSLLLEYKNKRLVFDPGGFSTQNSYLHDIDILLITHTHGDHLNIERIKYLLQQSTNLKLVCNKQVSQRLINLPITPIILEGTERREIDGIEIMAQDAKHEEIYKTYGQVQNTGYCIEDVFYHPGDAFATPNKKVKAVATPIAAPFMAVKQAIDYINNHQEMLHIGVHDGVLSEAFKQGIKKIITENLEDKTRYVHPEQNVEFITL